jgi:hypothetical protein
MSATVGGFFVVFSSRGLYWTGAAWSPKREEGRRFGAPLYDPWQHASDLRDQLRRGGFVCNVAYVPRPKVARR